MNFFSSKSFQVQENVSMANHPWWSEREKVLESDDIDENLVIIFAILKVEKL